ncbi:hypothetical protein OS189_02920 [Sulfitobacter sp. F26169L]|uniref:hypothetical protein n=1 Tax=Sulfitobacter sp. F26169L TaxID=2996015 RepID=UPI002260D57C|nr:hypothetical protein [Sulfitobacter sp. F26169L]MCX7565295.1 hypothetical protein [Sulfitobacter sp. F26169L]
MLPPDILLHIFIALPLFVAAIWWLVPALQRRTGVLRNDIGLLSSRIVVITIAVLAVVLMVSLVISGFSTVNEALILNAIFVIVCHVWLIRSRPAS